MTGLCGGHHLGHHVVEAERPRHRFGGRRLSPVSMTSATLGVEQPHGLGGRSLIGSATPRSRKAPSTARYITVCPSRRSPRPRGGARVPPGAEQAHVAERHRRPVASPSRPARSRLEALDSRRAPRARGTRQHAAASGCSSPAPGRPRAPQLRLRNPAAAVTATRRGFPSVSVRLVDDDRVHLLDDLETSAPSPARPSGRPAGGNHIAIGVASPSAHGQAMIRRRPRSRGQGQARLGAEEAPDK